MDNNIKFVIEKKVERVIQNLEKNNMKGYFVTDKKEAVEKVKELMQENDTVAVGGSMTLFETGIIDLLRNGSYNFLDRYAEGLSPEQVAEVHKKAFTADVYLASSNALTEAGELYNVDGVGNRVAAMIYGPKKVLVVVGINKIVKDLDQAILRNREWAAPANNKRLKKNTPCVSAGHCLDCSNPDRICNNYVVIKRQMLPERIHVIIVGEQIGY